jgi:hypothetical protein
LCITRKDSTIQILNLFAVRVSHAIVPLLEAYGGTNMRVPSALLAISLLAASPALAAPHDTQLFMPGGASGSAFTDTAINFGQNAQGQDPLGQSFGRNPLQGQLGQLRRELGIVERVFIFIRIKIVFIIIPPPVSP